MTNLTNTVSNGWEKWQGLRFKTGKKTIYPLATILSFSLNFKTDIWAFIFDPRPFVNVWTWSTVDWMCDILYTSLYMMRKTKLCIACVSMNQIRPSSLYTCKVVSWIYFEINYFCQFFCQWSAHLSLHIDWYSRWFQWNMPLKLFSWNPSKNQNTKSR